MSIFFIAGSTGITVSSRSYIIILDKPADGIMLLFVIWYMVYGDANEIRRNLMQSPLYRV